MSLKLPKEERIYKQRDIDNLFSDYKTIVNHPFKAHFKQNSLPHSRILISVPKKLFKKAVDRNLLKRRIRESYRHLKDEFLQDCNVDILFVYISKEIYDFEFIKCKIGEILKKVSR